MTKNSTRKGLALGAAFALAGTGLVATPAQAAGEVLFAPSAGTSYSVLLASDFVLNAGIDSAYPASNITTLGYKVVNNTNGNVTAVADSGGTDETLTVAATETETTSTFVATVGANTLTVSTAGSATGTVDVTAFLDANGNDTLDSGEWATTRTLTFVKPSEVTATTTFTAPALGGNTFTATVSLSGDINLAQVDADEVTVEFFKAGTSIADTDDTANSTGTVLTPAQRTNPVAATYDSTAGALKAVLYAEADANGADTDYTAYSVTAGTFSTETKVAGAVSGSAAVQTVAAATLGSYTVKVTDSLDAEPGTTGADTDVTDGTAGTAGTATVRSGANATVVATFLEADEDPVAGAAVKVTVTPANVAADDNVTVGGKAVSTAAVTIDAVTDANGQVSLAIVGGASDENDTLTFAYAVQGYTTANTVVTFKDADYYLYNTTNPTDERIVIAAGGSTTQSFTVVDQFGATISGDYQLEATRSGAGGRTTDASWVVTKNLVNGSAALTFVDNGSGADNGTGDTVAIALKKAAVGGGYTSATLTATADDEFVLNYVAALPAASALTLAATDTTPDLEAKAVAAADSRVVDAAETGYTDVSHVYGVATKADGSVAAGVDVVLSAADVLFQGVAATANGTATEADAVFSLGSVVVRTNASGQFEALVYSNKTGKKVITATSGSASKTLDVTWNAAAATAGVAVELDVAETVSAGSTVAVTATITDKFGNPVKVATANDVAFSYSGPGFTFPSTLPNTTDANGQAKFNIILGSNDSGTGTVTFSYDQSSDDDFTGTTASDADIVVSKSFTIGTVGNTGALASWTKNLNDGTVKMYAKNIVGAGKVQFMLNGKEIAWVRAADATDPKLREANGSYYLVRTVELVEGQKNVLEIYVDGVRTTRTAYTY